MNQKIVVRTTRRNLTIRTQGSPQISLTKSNATTPKLPALAHSSSKLSRMLSPVPSKKALPLKPKPLRFALSNFQVSRIIGTGTFSRVRIARFKDTGEVVVLKIMNKSDIVKKRQVEHVRNERDLMSSSNNLFLVSLKGSFQDRECLYLVQEYMPGGELYSVIRKKRNFNSRETCFYAAEVACALSYLHSNQTVYRDLKPENILLTERGHVKLADFGFAKSLEKNGRTFTLCGTPEYLAPEVIKQTGHDFSYDWWCLGILIYELMVGHAPFTDNNPYKLYEKIIGNVVTFPLGFDASARSLVQKLLEKDPDDRPSEEDIFAHEFFYDISWVSARRGDLEPPYTPELRGEDDTRNFDEYPEEQHKGDKGLVGSSLFANFG